MQRQLVECKNYCRCRPSYIKLILCISSMAACSWSACAQVVQQISAAHRCNGSVGWKEREYGATRNDASLVNLVEAAAGGISGARWLRLEAPTMAAEDFSFMAGAAQICSGRLDPVRP